jgi:hypothetical protein
MDQFGTNFQDVNARKRSYFYRSTSGKHEPTQHQNDIDINCHQFKKLYIFSVHRTEKLPNPLYWTVARCSVVRWGTTLQPGSSRGSIPYEVIGLFTWPHSSWCTMTLSTQHQLWANCLENVGAYGSTACYTRKAEKSGCLCVCQWLLLCSYLTTISRKTAYSILYGRL